MDRTGFTERDIERQKFVFYLDRNPTEARKWLSRLSNRPSDGQPTLDATCFREVLLKCLEQKEVELGRHVLSEVVKGHLTTAHCDAVLLWALGTGKGIEEVDRMKEVLERRSGIKLGLGAIHLLIRFAKDKDDHYMVERLRGLVESWGLQPDWITYSLQMDSRLSAGDIEGAKSLFFKMQTDQSHDERPQTPVINRLIQAMISSKNYDLDAIHSVVDFLSERRIRYEPETVAALCVLHLGREDYYDTIDLLRAHLFHFSTDERNVVGRALNEYCLDEKNSVAKVWDTYTIYQELLPEIDRSIRTEIMIEFFKRHRPDMAFHVFNHMRAFTREDTRPTIDTYVHAFTWIGNLGDVETLELVHNQLKLDMTVDPDTRLYNAMMIAHIGCNMSDRALDFWQDIIHSREGPSYNSIIIALRACERTHGGDDEAKDIWDKLMKMDIEITGQLFTAYVGALSGSDLTDEAKDLIMGMDKYGLKPDVLTLGALHNASTLIGRRSEIRDWIKDEFPLLWNELVDIGTHQTKTGFKQFMIDRSLSSS
ncbi:hypothetical protein K402DRAFT_333783 [Aulographum hederae CBS 113979]|uniref:Uncharacterized protein n=1 Tax=Aulographum hederae CBS 113979 TaxID=1176131 RepID=A0A6G1GYI8_9PEZI|nr:hypothetical protein K402DRAFT_333783 [Aulographum hederae CBS 113979]